MFCGCWASANSKKNEKIQQCSNSNVNIITLWTGFTLVHVQIFIFYFRFASFMVIQTMALLCITGIHNELTSKALESKRLNMSSNGDAYFIVILVGPGHACNLSTDGSSSLLVKINLHSSASLMMELCSHNEYLKKNATLKHEANSIMKLLDCHKMHLGIKQCSMAYCMWNVLPAKSCILMVKYLHSWREMCMSKCTNEKNGWSYFKCLPKF